MGYTILHQNTFYNNNNNISIMDYKIFLEWPFWLVVGLFFLSIPLMDKVEEMMVTKDTLYPALVFLLPVAAVIYFFVLPTIKKNK